MGGLSEMWINWKRLQKAPSYMLTTDFIRQSNCEFTLKQPSHDNQMLANSCWQTQIGVCVNDTITSVFIHDDVWFHPSVQFSLKQPSHDNQLLVNSCWQTQIGVFVSVCVCVCVCACVCVCVCVCVCERHNNKCLRISWRLISSVSPIVNSP